MDRKRKALNSCNSFGDLAGEPEMSATSSFRGLLASIEQGERRQATEVIVERYAGRLVALSARKMGQKLRQRVDPEDILQSVLATFFRRLDDGRIEIHDWESLWGLLARVAVHRICRHAERHKAARRSQDKEVSLEDNLQALDREPTAAEVLVAEELHEQLMKGLAEKYRPIVAMILEGATHESIAETLHTSLSTVERVHRRAREYLLAILTQEDLGQKRPSRC
jgi:RNA polymerase sigma factor (sigma-70 family)